MGAITGTRAITETVFEDGQWLTLTRTTTTKSWRLDGVYHRSGNKPAVIELDSYGNLLEEKYFIQGVSHRSDGTFRGVNNKTPWIHSLFGQPLARKLFDEVTTHSRNNSCPLFLSWLRGYRLITDEQIEALRDENGDWIQLPPGWLLKTLNLNEEDVFIAIWKTAFDSTFRDYLDTCSPDQLLRDYPYDIIQPQERFDDILKVASFLQQTNPVA